MTNLIYSLPTLLIISYLIYLVITKEQITNTFSYIKKLNIKKLWVIFKKAILLKNGIISILIGMQYIFWQFAELQRAFVSAEINYGQLINYRVDIATSVVIVLIIFNLAIGFIQELHKSKKYHV